MAKTGRTIPGAVSSADPRLLLFKALTTAFIAWVGLSLVWEIYGLWLEFISLGDFTCPVPDSVPDCASILRRSRLHSNILRSLEVAPSLAACALALALAWGAPHRADARVLVLFLAFLAFRYAVRLTTGNLLLPPPTETYHEVFRFGRYAAFVLAFAALARFSVLFPRPLTAQDLLRGSQKAALGLRWMGRVSEGVGWIFRSPLMLVPARYRVAAARDVRFATEFPARIVNPAILWPLALLIALLGHFLRYQGGTRDWIIVGPIGLFKPALLAILSFALVLCVTMLVIRNLRIGFSLTSPQERQSVFWLTEGLIVGGTLLLIALGMILARWAVGAECLFAYCWVSPSGIMVNPIPFSSILIALSLIFFLLGIAVAVFYSGAFDATLLIRRTTVYGLLSVIVVFLFAGVENAFEGLLATRLGLPASMGPWIAGGVVALAFNFVRDRVARFSNRFLPVPTATAAAEQEGGHSSTTE